MTKINPKQNIIAENVTEKIEAEYLLTTTNDQTLQVEDILKTRDKYIKDTVYDIKQELKILDQYISNKKGALVMVGFGYLPSTLLMIRKKFPRLTLVGVDSDIGVCSFVEKLLPKFEASGSIQIQHSKADEISYHDVDYIFLANALLNKKEILKAIYQTAKKEVIIFARTPIPSMKEMFEPVEINNQFIIKETLAGIDNTLWIIERRNRIMKTSER